MNEPIRCETCGSMLTLGGELGISCPRCLLSLASEPESQHETGQGILEPDMTSPGLPPHTIPR
jgi:hypothetical protein